MTDTIINIENYYAGPDENVEAMLDGYCAQWEDALEEVQELETANQALIVERDELIIQLDRWSTEAQEYREAFERTLKDREAVEAEMDERVGKLRQEMQERLGVVNSDNERLRIRRSAAEQRILVLEKLSDDRFQAIDKLVSELADADTQIDGLRRERLDAERERDALKLEIAEEKRLAVAAIVKLEHELEEAKEYAARNYEHSYAVDKDGNPKLGSIWMSTNTRWAWIYVGDDKYLEADCASYPQTPIVNLWVQNSTNLVPHPDYYGPDAKVEGE